MSDRQMDTRRGRMISLVIAGVALAWIGATALGAQLGWSQRTRALFDLVAVAGFLWSLWLIYGLWRDRQHNKD